MNGPREVICINSLGWVNPNELPTCWAFCRMTHWYHSFKGPTHHQRTALKSPLEFYKLDQHYESPGANDWGQCRRPSLTNAMCKAPTLDKQGPPGWFPPSRNSELTGSGTERTCSSLVPSHTWSLGPQKRCFLLQSVTAQLHWKSSPTEKRHNTDFIASDHIAPLLAHSFGLPSFLPGI